MNNLDDTIEHELLESLTLLEQAARQYISASGGGTLTHQKNLMHYKKRNLNV